jgi:hypothetical protein
MLRFLSIARPSNWWKTAGSVYSTEASLVDAACDGVTHLRMLPVSGIAGRTVRAADSRVRTPRFFAMAASASLVRRST